MKQIWIVEYCENVDDDSPFILQCAFATRELAEEYIDRQDEPDLYYLSTTFYFDK